MERRTINSILGLLTVFGSAIHANADEIAPFEINQAAEIFEVRFDATTKNLNKASVYFITAKDNSSSPAEIYLSAPAGVKFRGRSGLLGSRNPSEFLSSTSGGNALVFGLAGKAKGQQEVTLPQITDQAASGVNALFQIQRDACSAKTARYITQISIDLTGVPESAYDAGFVMKVGVLEYPYKNGRRASIKPSSDGKYKGEPIGLFETMTYGNEKVNIVSWRGASISRIRSTKIVKYVSYKGLSLSLARLKGFLNGGKATFELTNGSNIYGVCFALQRKRQSVNGYPNP